MLKGWWMGTDGEKVDLFSDTWMCVCVRAHVCEDHMSRLEGLSAHTSPNDKLQTMFAASEREDMNSEAEAQTLFFQIAPLFFSLLFSHTHIHTLPLQSWSLWCWESLTAISIIYKSSLRLSCAFSPKPPLSDLTSSMVLKCLDGNMHQHTHVTRLSSLSVL